MSIKLFLPDRLSRLAKNKYLFELNGETVGECLKHLVSLAPAMKRALYESENELDDHIIIFVNKKGIDAEGLVKKVQDGDVIHIAMLSQH